MRSIDRDVPLEDVRTLEEQVHFNIRSEELIVRLAAGFAVLAHWVARRMGEIGIRMALGAVPARIHSMVTDREPALRRSWEGSDDRPGRGAAAGVYGCSRSLSAQAPHVTSKPAGYVAV